MSQILNVEIIENVKLAQDLFMMKLKSEVVCRNAYPGQFVNIKCCDGINALLRRPISICSTNIRENTFRIVYRIKGQGTQFLSLKKRGDILDIIGPSGTGFEMEGYKKIAVIGGGIGIFPLLFLLIETKASYKDAFIGFRDRNNAVLADEFKTFSNRMFIYSEDGSIGEKGLVTDSLDILIKKEKYDIIYSCGPEPMLKKIAEISKINNTKCQISMEQRMGCGIGACLVCVCKTRYPNDNEWQYRKVCKDGPVFWSNDVIFD